MKTSLSLSPLAALALSAIIFAPCVSNAAPRASNTSSGRARRLHFARGRATLSVRGFLSGSQRRFYVLKTRGGQRLNIGARSAAGSQVAPLVMVTPPRGHYDGDKTATYLARSTHAGDYQIEVAASLMASNARRGPFILSISAR